jgi:hypothetical protein
MLNTGSLHSYDRRQTDDMAEGEARDLYCLDCQRHHHVMRGTGKDAYQLYTVVTRAEATRATA